jgi:hypothetical protein
MMAWFLSFVQPLQNITDTYTLHQLSKMKYCPLPSFKKGVLSYLTSHEPQITSFVFTFYMPPFFTLKENL